MGASLVKVSGIIVVMLFYQHSIEDTARELRSSKDGLSTYEASQRLKQYGPNSVQLKGESLWRKLIEPFANVFMAVLFLAVLISLWHHAFFDAVIIVVIMLTSAIVYYVQRFSTERILRSLQKKNVQQIEVCRGGEHISIEAAYLVPGDVVELSEGDKVPADIRLIVADGVRTDESVLTGESVPVHKSTDTLRTAKEIYEQSNILFQGSFLLSGTAIGMVIYTGNATEFGRIATLAGTAPNEAVSPVQQKIDKLIGYIVAAVSGVAIVAFLLALSRGMELGEALRFVIALSVSAVPESLPVAISVVLVLGMRRMAAKKALVRTMSAIETIGVVTTIATDKTGTLTKNILSVQETWHPKWATQSLALTMYKSINHRSGERTQDPLDRALSHYSVTSEGMDEGTGGVTSSAANKPITLPGADTREINLPFDQAYAMSGAIWRTAHQTANQWELAVKGAPEHIIERSHLTKSQAEEIEAALQQLTSQGYRVIAVAHMPLKRPLSHFIELPAKQKLSFVGLVAVADTLRPTARHAIAVAQRAGVSVRMITGDHRETAYAIGLKLGLVSSRDEVFDSRRMDELSDSQLATEAHNAKVFSRVTPENKFRLLQVLKLTEVTAMTGDGVNDVPALANAHVGVAMGSGSQIAKDAGEIILLNDDFANIVRAVREGRIIFANIRRMLFYLLSTNIGEVLTTIGAMLIGLPMPLVPVQILWINLVTDTTMVIPLGLEPGEKTIMQAKPVAPDAPILSAYMISRLVLVAFCMCALSLGLYSFYTSYYGSDYARTVVFLALVVVQWANAFNARSTLESIVQRFKVRNSAFWAGLVLSVTLQTMALVGPLQGLLHVHPIALADIAIVTLIALAVALLPVEIHKAYGRFRLLANID